MSNEKNFLEKIKWRLGEIEKTFSNQPSFYSSKRIERAVIFLNAVILFDIMAITLLRDDKIDYIAAVAIFTAQMFYAGYQTTQIRKDITPPAINNEK